MPSNKEQFRPGWLYLANFMKHLRVKWYQFYVNSCRIHKDKALSKLSSGTHYLGTKMETKVSKRRKWHYLCSKTADSHSCLLCIWNAQPSTCCGSKHTNTPDFKDFCWQNIFKVFYQYFEYRIMISYTAKISLDNILLGFFLMWI